MKIQPLAMTDYYKQSHYKMYPKGTSKVYSNMTARKSRMEGVNHIVFFGLQYFIKEYLLTQWKANFFDKPWDEVQSKYLRLINNTLGKDAVSVSHLKQLHDLGYLPLKIKAVPEGSRVPIRVPFMTVTNTVDHAYWLVNFLETIWSCTLWQACTSATIADVFRTTLEKWADQTCEDRSFVQWQGHDFSMRGMSSLESACISGAAHLLSFTGTDTVPAIEFLEEYYGADVEQELIGASVPATEHSVASFNIAYSLRLYEDWRREFIDRTPPGVPLCDISRQLIKEYAFLKWYITECVPSGIASYVADTYNIFSVVSEILPRLKDEIMARDGKLVIRPDSFWTNPEDCLCGYDGQHDKMELLDQAEKDVVRKGLIKSLWDIFGGKTNSKGYRELDPHIGAIYGDSISIERANTICSRLEKAGFASNNVVFGIGSYTYQHNTRDTFGFAVKATYGEVKGEPFELSKDPISDDGVKKSAKGLIAVNVVTNNPANPTDYTYAYTDSVSESDEAHDDLWTIFQDGNLITDLKLSQIRKHKELN